MRIGVLGTGEVGRVLGAGFASHGHQVTIGSRDPKQEKVQAWVKATGQAASAGTFAEAAAFGDIAVLAASWEGTESALALAGPKQLAGKVVIDATNPLIFSQGAPPTLAVAGNDSAGETVQRRLPGARVVALPRSDDHGLDSLFSQDRLREPRFQDAQQVTKLRS